MINDYRAEHHATLFGFVAKDIFERAPEKAADILKDVVVAYGEERGRRMGKRAEIDGLPLNMNTYMLYREYPVEEDKFSGGNEILPDGTFHTSPTMCPWSAQWRKLGLDKYSGVYCRYVDNALGRGFHHDVLIESKGNLTDGGGRCELWFYAAHMDDPINIEKMKIWGPKIRNSNAIKDFDYQLAHTYVSMERTLGKHFPPEEVKAIMAKGIEGFESVYGKGYADEFLAMTDIDFNSVADYKGAAAAAADTET